MSTSGEYHEYIRGCSVHWGIFSTSEFSIEIERILIKLLPHMYHDIPPMY